MAVLLTALSLLLCFLWILANRFHRRTKKKNLVPEAGGSWPLLGHLLLLRGPKPIHTVLGEMADKYGSVFMIKLGIKRAVVVCNWEIAKECLTINDRALASRPITVFSQILCYNTSMLGFAPYGNFWRQMRKLMMLELYSPRRLEAFKTVRESELRAAARELYKIWEMGRDDSGRVEVEMKKWSGNITFNVIMKIVFGKTMGYGSGEEDGNKKVRDNFMGFFDHAGRFLISDALPFLRWMDIGNEEKKMRSSFEKMDFDVDQIMKEHKEKRNGARTDEDLMDILFTVFEKPENVPEGRDPDTINKSNCLGKVLAASDTTSSSITWALVLMLNHPHVLKKAQEEIDALVGKDRLVSESDTKNLVFLDAVIKETMRLHPAGALALPHLAMEDCSVAGYHIPAGTTVFIHIAKIQRDPRVWSKADEFRPERFLSLHKDMELKGQNFELMPFGSGRRMCPGANFALLVLRLSVATLIHGFNLETTASIDVTEKPGLVNHIKAPVDVFLSPRLSREVYQ